MEATGQSYLIGLPEFSLARHDESFVARRHRPADCPAVSLFGNPHPHPAVAEI